MKYPFRVYQMENEGHCFWIAESQCLKGCVGQGEGIEEACRELELNENDWLEAAKAYNFEIPPVPVEDVTIYSGKFTVRVSASVHKEAAELAKKEGVSLNQYVNDAIVERNSRLTVIAHISPDVESVIQHLRKQLLPPVYTANQGSSRKTYMRMLEDNPYKLTNLGVKQ